MMIYDSTSKSVGLGAELGRGGEGKVCLVTGQPQLVAKIYHGPIEPEKAAKLRHMTQHRTDRLLSLTAWPLDTLHNRPGGDVIGLLMPKVDGYKPIHSLYGPKDRLKNFPDATWPFLIHSALNVAVAFDVVHEHGHVVGDVNHGNLLVAANALVKFIDCDSFQVTAQGSQYLCEVGVSTHTPPELQGKPLGGIVRTTNHDAFGLAVLIFQLLFMGRHPFSGNYLGIGEMSLERAIQEIRFAYGENAGSIQMKQPPATLPLAALSQQVAALFERAFSASGAQIGMRPSPREWSYALDELEKSLAKCRQHTGHYFLRTLSSCPWCEIEFKTGAKLFQYASAGDNQTLSNFNLEAVWAQIIAIPVPASLPALPTPAFLNTQPSAPALQQRKYRMLRQVLAWGIGGFVSLAVFTFQLNVTVAFWLIIVIIWGAFKIANAGNAEVRKEADSVLETARARWRTIEQRWLTEANEAQFRTKLQHLEKQKKQHQELPDLLLKKLRKLEDERRERQLYKYLDSHQIYTAAITGIGANRKITLRSYGIETAADISESAVLKVPGFGPALTADLLVWKRAIERQFVFNPAIGVDQSDIEAVHREVVAMRLKLERELQDGLSVLRQTGQQIEAKRQFLKPIVEGALKSLAQAEADKKCA